MMMMIRCSMKQNRASGKRGRGRKRKQETGTNKQATKLRRRTCVVYLDVDDRPVDEPEARSLAPWIRRTVGRGKKRARRAESGREAPNPRKLIKKILRGRSVLLEPDATGGRTALSLSLVWCGG
jgi:hypothetical protein